MFGRFISYFWSSPADISLDDVFDTLKVDDSIEETNKQVDNEILDYVCYHRTGVVTSVAEDHIIIDNLYTCNKADFNVTTGTKVSFICYTVENKIQISNVNILDNEWNCDESNRKSNWCYRNLIGKVIKREKRNVFIEPGDIVVNLDKVNSEFIPSIGDWLQLDVKSEIDENVTDLFGEILEIHRISPLRHKVLEGIVKTWDTVLQNGTINFNISFNRESLCAGYLPLLKDKVIVEAIESEQGKCTWRALKVLSSSNGNIEQIINTFTPQYDIDNENIRISDDIYIQFTRVNDSINFKFEVTNLSEADIILKDIVIEKSSHQCRIQESLPLCISIGRTINISGECVVKTAGYSKELLIFSFDEYKIGRWIEFSPKESNQYSSEHVRYTNRRNLMSNTRKFMQDNDKVVVKAPKPYVPARFVSYKLPEYNVPSKLWNIFLNFDDGIYPVVDELKSIKPVFNHALAFQNYEERFHTLIHLEEINCIVEIRKFDRDQISFIPNGEYLMLEYENLCEQRPSIIVGDTILAKDSLSDGRSCLEGYVYKVASKHVYLKFTQKFHEDYKGEDYAVNVVQSRTQFRRMHQAVGFAVKNLGRKFLFPTQITLTEPQLNFTYESYDDVQHKQPNKKTRLSHGEILKILRGSDGNCLSESNNDNVRVPDSPNIQKSKLDLNKTDCKMQRNVRNRSKLRLEWFDNSLNYYQKEAVRHILLGEARPLPYFIFGPPGTGKTVTLVEVILQILRMAPSRILVATPSNSAANLICIRLIKSGVLRPGDLVRLVSYKSINDNSIPAIIAPYCATASVGVHGTGSNNSFVTERGLTLGCNSKTIGKHRITIGTCTTLGVLYSLAFAKGHFSHIIIDEAGQATEPETMIPLSFFDTSTGQCILAGDPMQLGPVVCSKYASEFGLCESFMERLLTRFPYVRDLEGFPKTGGYDPKLVSKLIYNYRSLPGVLELPNSMFYFSELESTISAEDSELAKTLFKFKEFLPKGRGNIPPAFVFHGVDGENYQVKDSPSWYNPHEISQVFYYVNELYRAGCTAEDIGIITPYSKQTKEIRAVLTEAEFDVPKIGTVEEFQGQEFNIIILSTVRSNRNMLVCDRLHNLGFVTQPKRVNVALTRAQALTIIVGNPHLLINDSTWRYIIQFAIEKGGYCGCDLPEL